MRHNRLLLFENQNYLLIFVWKYQTNTLISAIMNLYPQEWLALPDGRRYQGETIENSCIPHGLGIITLDDDQHFYVGEFAHGKRHGRGFTLTHKQWEAVEPVWVNGTGSTASHCL